MALPSAFGWSRSVGWRETEITDSRNRSPDVIRVILADDAVAVNRDARRIAFDEDAAAPAIGGAVARDDAAPELACAGFLQVETRAFAQRRPHCVVGHPAPPHPHAARGTP